MGIELLVVMSLCVLLMCAAEYRGAYITTWSAGFRTPEEIDLTIEAAEAAGINSLVVEVRKTGDAYYHSEIEPVAPEAPAGFDPLAYVIDKAHPKGISVHAWLVVYRVWKGVEKPDAGHILAKHPEWKSLNFQGEDEPEEGVYIDPGVPEYQEYFAEVCADIARRYDVDSIHYDYVRYPNQNWGYCQIALDRYYAETGTTARPDVDDPKWQQWKRDQVTSLVTLVQQSVRAANPNVKIQASTIPWGSCPENFEDSRAYRDCCQDWRMWMEKGLIDENCPMIYANESDETSAAYFRKWVDGAARWSYGRPVYVAIGAMRNTTQQLLAQIDVIRKAGLQGFVLFAFNQSEHRLTRAKELGEGLRR